MDRIVEIFTTVKNLMVALIQRLCFSVEDDDNAESYHSGERARLLPAAETSSIVDDGSQESLQGHESNFYNARQLQTKPVTGSIPKSKNDDQSALKEILSTMANDILDVTVFNQQFNQTMETGDYQERSHQYGKRLSKEAANLVSRHNGVLLKPTTTSAATTNMKSDAASKAPDAAAAGLEEISTGEVWSELGIADTDTMLIDEVVSRAKESSGPQEFHLKDVDRILARFEPRIDEDDEDLDVRA